jgi:hypothetical protein
MMMTMIYLLMCIEQVTGKREVSFLHVPTSSTTTQPLEIIGTAGQTLANRHAHVDIVEEEVLDEVLLLLARLDRERLRLINACEGEQDIRTKLRENVDHWRLKRLRDLPIAVQKGSIHTERKRIDTYSTNPNEKEREKLYVDSRQLSHSEVKCTQSCRSSSFDYFLIHYR